MRTDLTALAADLTAMHADMVTGSELATLRRDLMERMDRFENKLTDIRDDITVNMGGGQPGPRYVR